METGSIVDTLNELYMYDDERAAGNLVRGDIVHVRGGARRTLPRPILCIYNRSAENLCVRLHDRCAV